MSWHTSTHVLVSGMSQGPRQSLNILVYKHSCPCVWDVPKSWTVPECPGTQALSCPCIRDVRTVHSCPDVLKPWTDVLVHKHSHVLVSGMSQSPGQSLKVLVSQTIPECTGIHKHSCPSVQDVPESQTISECPGTQALSGPCVPDVPESQECPGTQALMS